LQSRALTSSRIKHTRISCNFSVVGLITIQAPCPVVGVAQAGSGSEHWHCLHVQSTKAVDRYVVSSQYSISGRIAHTLYNKTWETQQNSLDHRTNLSLTARSKAAKLPSSPSPSTASHVAFNLSRSGGLLALSIKPISFRPSNLNQPHTTFILQTHSISTLSTLLISPAFSPTPASTLIFRANNVS
jgi:hypothetical protein